MEEKLTMFTGIVLSAGKVVSVAAAGNSIRFSVDAPERDFSDVAAGESIAVSGVCLTAEKAPESAKPGVLRLVFFASGETCSRSNLGALKPGDTVNLERALKLSDRLSGHLVQGHVDGQAELLSIQPVGESRELTFRVRADLARYIVEKGSVALDGISLTVNAVRAQEFSVVIIPYTWGLTHLSSRQPGDRFNVELDVIAKYVEKLVWTASKKP